MRVLYFSTEFGPHDHRFLASLARTRHEVFFLQLAARLGPPADGRLPARIHQVAWAGLRGPFRWWAVPKLVSGVRRAIKEVRPDLIHAGPIQTCAFLAVLSGFRPILTMSWGFDLMQDVERSPLWRWVTRYTLRRSTFFVSDAMVTRSRAVSYGMAPERTAVFPWGVDLRRFTPRDHRGQSKNAGSMPGSRKPKSPRRFDRPRMVLLCNRSWEERYGVDVLARAFVIAAPKLPRSSLILLGDGSQSDTIRAILAQGLAAERVQFGGRIPQARIHEWYRKADLYISPSHVDGSSVSLMEALACGTPALVSDIPANREWVSDGVNGWLFRDGDPKHLAERIVWIAGRRAVLARIGRAARKTAEERADWRRNFNVLLDAYEQAVAQGRQV
jgi:L-malate glycosyltransferase